MTMRPTGLIRTKGRSSIHRMLVVLLSGALVLSLSNARAIADPAAGGPCADATILGTNGDDTLTGTDGNDIIDAGNGKNTVDGRGGDDIICGDNGKDTLIGGPGDDKIYGGNGKDVLRGGSGNDVLDGGNGKDVCTSGEKYVNCELTQADPGFSTTVVGSRNAEATVRSEDRIPKYQLSIRSDYFRSRIALDKRAAFAYEFSSEQPFKDADITIPYFPKAQAVRDGDPARLRIYGYDEQHGLWYRVPGEQHVDTGRHTVTATVQHFSLYTVFQEGPGGDSGLSSYWESKPVWCLAKNDPNTPGIDVSFVIGGAASMATSDPDGGRAEAAKQFVDAMRPVDRAAVVGFNDTATTYLGLTSLDTSGAGAVKSALDRTKAASGGNNLDAAVKAATKELTASPARGHPRVAVLISDGPGPLADTTIDEAVDNDVVIYTVGLGGDTSQLKSIADKTGGRYLTLSDPTRLPAIYKEVSDDLVDEGTDTDGDGVTDCVERRGALTAQGMYADDQPFKTGRYVRTDPAKPDTDGDGLTDGQELGPRLDLRDTPELAATYQFLIDAGITRFFNPTSNPTSVDTDGDGLKDDEEKQYGTNAFIPDTDRDGSTDYEEVQAGVTDPLVPDSWIWAGENGAGGPAAIPGLAPLTLVLPDPNHYPWPYEVLVWDTEGARKGDCSAYCQSIYDWAQAEYQKKSWLCKLLTTCQPDDIRKEWIQQAVDVQGLFTYDDGHMRRDFVQDFIAYNCQTVAARPEECFSQTVEDKADHDYYYQDLEQAVIEILSVIPGGTRPPDPEIDTAKSKLEQLAKQACEDVPQLPGQTAQSWGKKVHTRFEELIQNSGDSTLFGETGYLNGQIVGRVNGNLFPKNTTAPDAGFGTPDRPRALFDLKTGEKGIQASWLGRLTNNLKGIASGVPVFELRC